MVIHAHLNPIENGCNYSKHFKDQWINNEKLHPKAKSIKVVTHVTYNTAQISLYDRESIVLSMKGNMINPAKLQEFILNEML